MGKKTKRKKDKKKGKKKKITELVLVVEDEASLRETLEYNLKRQGYRVKTASDGSEAVDIALEVQPDAIVLDVMLPIIDGLEVCRILRQEMNVPILMLTARDSEIDRVLGLEIGADDYLTKPFSMRELIARVKAMLRRVEMDLSEWDEEEEETPELELLIGNLALDTARHEVRLNGDPLALKPKEYDLLVYLAQHQGQALSRDMIMERVWGWNYTGGSRTVDVHVRWLRQKIEPDPTAPVRIVTVRGSGYRFEG